VVIHWYDCKFIIKKSTYHIFIIHA
jgi:hypothetical protein